MKTIEMFAGMVPIRLNRYLQQPRHFYVINGTYVKNAGTENEALADYFANGSPCGDVERVEQQCGESVDDCEACQLERIGANILGARVTAVRDAPDEHGKRRFLLDLVDRARGRFTVAFEVVEGPID